VSDRIWVNEERTILVTQWDNGTIQVATRDHPSHTWGPPTTLTEEAQMHNPGTTMHTPCIAAPFIPRRYI
jgi:hypothetical protein